MSEPEIISSQDPNYRSIFVSGIFGGHRPGYFEMIIYSDEMDAKEALRTAISVPQRVKIKRTLQTRLVMDPFQAKSTLVWLKQHVEAYEKTFGPIPSPEEVASKMRKSGLE